MPLLKVCGTTYAQVCPLRLSRLAPQDAMGYGYKECKESAWDWVSEYSTPMNAVVKNPCLGVLHVTCKIIIVFYIAVSAPILHPQNTHLPSVASFLVLPNPHLQRAINR